jgi:uncharacterized protein YndB with AHSA1/START domain
MDILHRVGIKSSVDEAYKALVTREGLAAWWTNNTEGDSKVGGVLQFRFGAGGFDMKILELQPARRVLWEVVDGPGNGSAPRSAGTSNRKVTTPSFSSSTRAGRRQWNSCTTAAPSGRLPTELEVAG